MTNDMTFQSNQNKNRDGREGVVLEKATVLKVDA